MKQLIKEKKALEEEDRLAAANKIQLPPTLFKLSYMSFTELSHSFG